MKRAVAGVTSRASVLRELVLATVQNQWKGSFLDSYWLITAATCASGLAGWPLPKGNLLFGVSVLGQICYVKRERYSCLLLMQSGSFKRCVNGKA
ncbi:hypothetical protein V6N12_004941 [Hibiscus sabdariffa]|uniref:Uncharacterized protein n=1 Tax=Hibiscus sabdariffa TaxID=183260 RepID=A0ABR2CN06_9ROSI